MPDDIHVRIRPLYPDFFFGSVPVESDKIPLFYSSTADWEHFAATLKKLIAGEENIMYYCNETYAAQTWVGKNFQDWCASDCNDERKIFYDKTPFGSFTSDGLCDYEVLAGIRKCRISSIQSLDSGWHIELEAEGEKL